MNGRLRWLGLLVIACRGMWGQGLVELDAAARDKARLAPLVIVGLIEADEAVGEPVLSRIEEGTRVQLRRVRMRVENVLAGSLESSKVQAYYYGFAGGFNGPRPLGFWSLPSRRIVWLLLDGGVHRLACDGWDGCTRGVESGAHPGYVADVRKQVEYAIIDIVLTRGEGRIEERRFAASIGDGVPDAGREAYVISKLSLLAAGRSTEVRRAACYQLWIYGAARDEEAYRSDAKAASQAANCRCAELAGHKVVCQ